MTFSQCLARSLAKTSLYGLLLVAALVGINANASTEQEALPAGINECWNPHTAQIFIVQGECPTYTR